jgi:hypothetical protein
MTYITTPTYTTPNRVTCVPGDNTTTSCKLLVATVNDPTSDPVTVTVNGLSYVSGIGLTLTARGTNIVWTGVLDITGLSAFTRYSWTVSQGANSDSGSLMTEPRAYDDFAFFFAGCDNNTELTNSAGTNPATVPGYWQHTKTYYDSGVLPVAGVLFVDDLGYVDALNVDDTDNGDGGTGLVSGGNPDTTLDVDDYLIAYCCVLGMTGIDAAPLYSDISSSGNQVKLLWGRETNRAFCRKNLNVFAQWGDHEFDNDLGWSALITTYPNARFVSAGVDGVGKTAWDAFYGLIQPTSAQSADTVANHWTKSLGPCCLAAMDRVSSSVGSASMSYADPITEVTVYGTNQITDTLTAINTHNKTFTFFGMSTGWRYLATQGAGVVNVDVSVKEYGTQHALHNHAEAEYQRLITQSGQTPKSLMDNPITNGTRGFFIPLHSDYHYGCGLKYQRAAYTGNLAEAFNVFHLGTTNGSVNFTAPPEVTAEDVEVADVVTEYAQGFHDYLYPGNRTFHGVRVDITGSESPKVAKVYLMNYANDIMWSKQYVQWFTDNYGETVGEEHALPRVGVAENNG